MSEQFAKSPRAHQRGTRTGFAMAALCVVNAAHMHRDEGKSTDILGPLTEKNSPGMAMSFPGAQAQAINASGGGSLHIDARNFAGQYSSAGPLSGKSTPGMATTFQGAQAQAMRASRGGSLHIDARKFTAPRFELNQIHHVNEFSGRCDLPAAYLDVEPSQPDGILKKDSMEKQISSASTDVPDSPESNPCCSPFSDDEM